MVFAGWGATEWAAFGTCATLVVYVVIGVLAWRQLRESREVWRQQNRPYVVVDFEFRRFRVLIAVKNIGATPARDVRIAFDQPLRTSRARTRDVNQASVFTTPIAMLAPGRTIRVFFDSGPDLFADPALPKAYTATVTYRDHAMKRVYTDPPYVLDLSHYEHAVIDPPGVPELVGEVKHVRKELHRLTDGSHGVLAFTVDRDKQRAREHRSLMREDAGRVLRDDGPVAYVRWQWGRLLRRYGARR